MTTTVWVITCERMYSLGYTPDTSDRCRRPSLRSKTNVNAAVAIEAKNDKDIMNAGAINSVTVGFSLPINGAGI
ncbi:hypothetical protein DERP_005572 [Dermatophagoides pteronyssinus]|uniref:Uncharacterized protein n=1 Tax=Dermatophagoides pteronyssinus TaxID=6956 RepID=A0ABQ8IVX2_DERPT|nr:hypothetical protein DERP_015257 [Dermatophagoides pteronyssinus]KAH9423987.1 hypothetical protein DERP_005572 [Dermatophagoides pteronyssinus]